MAIQNAIFLVDGENLTARYQAMVANGSTPKKGITHIPDIFVWHPSVTAHSTWDIIRVSYYTSATGDDQTISKYKSDIAKVTYSFDYDLREDATGTGQVVPYLYKKPSKSHKTRLVDLNISIDFMRFAYNPSIHHLVLLTGDSDFVPLISEGMRLGKQVYVGAFSSGLGQELCHSCDEFISLDNMFFQKAAKKKEKGI